MTTVLMAVMLVSVFTVMVAEAALVQPLIASVTTTV